MLKYVHCFAYSKADLHVTRLICTYIINLIFSASVDCKPVRKFGSSPTIQKNMLSAMQGHVSNLKGTHLLADRSIFSIFLQHEFFSPTCSFEESEASSC